MIFATAISLVLSVIAILISFRSFYFTKRQTELMEEQEARKKREDESAAEWAGKFDQAVSAVQKIAPQWIQTKAGQQNAYGLAFPGPDLVPRIERYLIEEKLSRGTVRARQMDGGQLRLPSVQETITQVLDCVRKFKQDWPDEAKKLGL